MIFKCLFHNKSFKVSMIYHFILVLVLYFSLLFRYIKHEYCPFCSHSIRQISGNKKQSSHFSELYEL